MPIKYLILKPLASLALLFVFAGAEGLFSFSDSVFVDSVEASDKDKDKDKDKDSDTGCDLDDDGFCYKKNKLTIPSNCSNVNKLQIIYHKDFISTVDAPGPNILVVGKEGTSCSILIEKISGGNKCGFKVTKSNGKLFIDTKPKGNAKNCEMCIKVDIDRNTKILG